MTSAPLVKYSYSKLAEFEEIVVLMQQQGKVGSKDNLGNKKNS
jgi:hypothetical protein